MEIPTEISDFGGLLRLLRNNHGYSMEKVSKLTGLPLQTIAKVETGKYELPKESELRKWLSKLGCGERNINKIMEAARSYRIRHWLKINPKEPCNADLIRLLARYREGNISDYDRALLKLVAR
jgi:transcriptional regulator with XRE-family HTH domain